MKLRDRQVAFSDRCHTALEAHGNTLGVAPTGAGKTVMGSHIVGRRKPKAALVLQHRDELVTQNRSEEHTSELQSLMRNSYAVICLKTKIQTKTHNTMNTILHTKKS